MSERVAAAKMAELRVELQRAEAAGAVPAGHLRALADAGLFGVLGPVEAGGLGGDVGLLAAVAERLASGCLATTFVWLQHHGAVGAVAACEDDALREAFLAPLCRGALRSGVAFSALRRPGPPAMRAARAPAGWALTGSAPWVTGWGHADVIRTAARDDATGDVVWLLMDAADAPTLRAEPLHPVAVDAADTVTLTLDAHVVPADRLLGTEPYDAWRERDRHPQNLRTNGALALGIARRCAALLDDDDLRARLDATRAQLDTAATPDAMAAARAAASDLALRAARTLIVSGAGRAVVRGTTSERLGREALFTLVFGQAPAIRAAQLAR